MEQYQIASDELAAEIPKLRKLVETDIKALEKANSTPPALPTPPAASRTGKSKADRSAKGERSSPPARKSENCADGGTLIE